MSTRPSSRPVTRPITRPVGRPITRKRNRRITQRGVALRGGSLAAVLQRAASIAVGLGVMAGLLLGVQYGWRTLRDTNRLQVQSIEVLGSSRVQWDELEAYTELHVGDPILDLDLDGIAMGLRRHPWVASATVRRRLPDHVALEIVEHEPAILVSLGDLYIADRGGRLFKRLQAQDRVVLPVITGLDRDFVAAGAQQAQAVIVEGIALAAALAGPDVAKALGGTEELHWDRDLGWSGMFGTGAKVVRVHLGTDPVSRIDLAVAAMRRLDRLGRRPAAVFADGPLNRRSVQVSLRSGSLAQPTLIAKAGE